MLWYDKIKQQVLTKLGLISIASGSDGSKGGVGIAVGTTGPGQRGGWVAISSACIMGERPECGDLCRSEGGDGLSGQEFRSGECTCSVERREERNCKGE